VAAAFASGELLLQVPDLGAQVVCLVGVVPVVVMVMLVAAGQGDRTDGDVG
jgi:hypothetical protein